MQNLKELTTWIETLKQTISQFKAGGLTNQAETLEAKLKTLEAKKEILPFILQSGADSGLNENETYVLLAIAEAHGNAGGDFTYFDEVAKEMEEMLTENQVKGYVSKLQQKGFILVGDDQHKQINMNRKAASVIESLGDYVNLY